MRIEQVDFDDAVTNYIHSQKFTRLATNTKRIYLDGIKVLDEHLSGKKLASITRPMVIGIRDTYYDRPGKCYGAMNALNNILKYAYDRGYVERNVATGIGDMPKSVPIPRWQEDEIDRWINGDPNRFVGAAPYYLKDAMLVALYTGQRNSDLTKMQWDDYNGATIHVVQRKTGVELWIPVHPKLKARLDGMKMRLPQRSRWGATIVPCKRILQNHNHEPWSSEALRAAFKRRCAVVGITGRQLHGIRKTTASILAEMGCTALQIMSITGHQTLKEIVRYTKEAEKKRMAQDAIDKWQ